MKSFYLLAGFLFFSVLSGCTTHVEKIKAVEGDLAAPYESLGTLDVHVTTHPWKPVNWGWGMKKIFTLGFADTSYAYRLRKKLVKSAKKHPDADQIIKVEYWPDLDSEVFPDGQVRARGEMVRYKPFPEAERAIPALAS